MSEDEKPTRQRAERGSIETRLNLRMTKAERREAKRAAKRMGISETEFWRRAGRELAQRAEAP